MDFAILVQERYSLRKFDAGRAVEEEKVQRMLTAAHVAPTAHNNQPQRVWVVRSEKALAALRPLTPCHYNAPMIFVIGYDETVSWKREQDGKDHGEIDAAIAVTQMMLQAAEDGLGTCYVGMFEEDPVRQALGIDEKYRIVALLPTGYGVEGAHPSRLHHEKQPIGNMVTEL